MERNNLRNLWEQRLAEYEDSGNTIKAWCQEQSIPENQLYYWRKKLRLEQVKKNEPIKWLAVNIAGNKAGTSDSITVHIGQVAIGVKSGFNHSLLQEILTVLQTV